MKPIPKIIKLIKKGGLYPDIKIVEDNVDNDPVFIIDNKEIISFNSGNYLGLSNYKPIKEKLIEGFTKYGVHPSNSPLVSGTWNLHREYEKQLADFSGFDNGMLFSTTTMANIGVIPAISNLPVISAMPMGKLLFGNQSTALFSDELNHATIIDGCRLSKAERIVYKHLDLLDLTNKLKKNKAKRKIIISDGIFSMDGHIVPLPELIDIAKKYKAYVVIDDAHAMGVLGENGSGTMEHFKIKDGVDILITSLSKGFGLQGSVVCASAEMIDYLRISARTYIFTRSFLGPMSLAGLDTIEIIKSDEGKRRRKKLWSNVKKLKDGLEYLGFNTMDTTSHIVPILIGDEKKARKTSQELFNKGIYVPPIQWPAVPKGEARLRFLPTALFENQHIEYLLNSLKEIKEKYKII